jgi:hypothetical protein
MKKFVSTAAAAFLITGLSAGSAFAKQKRPGMHGSAKAQGMTMGRSSMPSGNAAMSGNNGNSASGSNAIPNVKGGDSGSGR